MTPQSSSYPLRVIVVAADPIVAGPVDALLAPLTSIAAFRVPTPAAAAAARAAMPVDVVLVDLALTGDDEIQELGRQQSEAHPVAVVGLLRQDCPLRTSEALNAGAQECLVIADLTPARLERSLRQALERQRVQQRLADLALRDDLTGLYNRRGVLALGEYQRRQCLRSGRTLVVVEVDVDGLKTINDTWGHQAGDQAIAGTASILRCTFRESDIIGRVGGDEFLALAVDADAAAVHRVQKRLTQALAAHNLRKTTPFPLSFSVGTSVLIPPSSPSLSDLIARADGELYRSKRTEHRVVPGWMPPMPQPVAVAVPIAAA
jgi:diguanylate cyclase (GGDEF)-like protein